MADPFVDMLLPRMSSWLGRLPSGETFWSWCAQLAKTRLTPEQPWHTIWDPVNHRCMSIVSTYTLPAYCQVIGARVLASSEHERVRQFVSFWSSGAPEWLQAVAARLQVCENPCFLEKGEMRPDVCFVS